MNQILRVVRQHHLKLKNDYHKENKSTNEPSLYGLSFRVCRSYSLISTNSTNPPPSPAGDSEVRGGAELKQTAKESNKGAPRSN